MIIAGLVLLGLGVFWCFIVFVVYSTHPTPSLTSCETQFIAGLIVISAGIVLIGIGGVIWQVS